MKLTIERRRSFAGFTFIIPWVVGFLFLYAYPLVMSLVYTFNDMNPATAELTFAGIKNYHTAFRVDPDYVKTLLNTLKESLYKMPLILIYSMVVSLLFNQKFKSARFFRGIFFLPIIITSGAIIETIKGDDMSALLMSGERSGTMLAAGSLQETVRDMGLGEKAVEFVGSIVSGVFELAWASGVQVLLFLTGLQAINTAVYEAASIDGCTAWEKFWKITFPLVAPMTIVNVIYTLTDSFVSVNNATMKKILTESTNLKFAYSSTLAWIYFLIIIVVIGAAYLLINKRITYIDM